jgi:hypothetical protein
MLGRDWQVNLQLGDHLARGLAGAVAAASLPARGRPPQAAARRAGLEMV